MTQSLQTTVRRLGPGDEEIVRGLAEGEPHARSRGITEGFVLTEPDNVAANTLYESLGGERSDTVLWDYRYADS